WTDGHSASGEGAPRAGRYGRRAGRDRLAVVAHRPLHTCLPGCHAFPNFPLTEAAGGGNFLRGRRDYPRHTRADHGAPPACGEPATTRGPATHQTGLGERFGGALECFQVTSAMRSAWKKGISMADILTQHNASPPRTGQAANGTKRHSTPTPFSRCPRPSTGVLAMRPGGRTIQRALIVVLFALVVLPLPVAACSPEPCTSTGGT